MYQIEKYKTSDLKPLLNIYTQARAQGLFKEQGPILEKDFSSIVEDEHIYIAHKKKLPIAFVSIYPQQSFVHHLYVLPNYQKLGIGRALLNHIRNIYDLPLSLKCEKENLPAVSFYLNSGWKKFKNGSEIDGTEYILMTLDLD